MKGFLMILLLLGAMGGAFYYYLQWESERYTADFQKIIEGSGVSIAVVSCEQAGEMRKVVCRFASNPTDLRTLNNYLEMRNFDDETGLIGRSFFMYGSNDPCTYDARIARGDRWLRTVWDARRAGAKQMTYSSVAIIFDALGTDACMVLDIRPVLK